jgi:putative membrane protein
MMWGYGTAYTWGAMLLMIFSMLFWFAFLGALIWGLVHWLSGRSAPSVMPGNVSALEILRQRYARGEIDDATFERMRQQLLGSNVAANVTPPTVSTRALIDADAIAPNDEQPPRQIGQPSAGNA